MIDTIDYRVRHRAWSWTWKLLQCGIIGNKSIQSYLYIDLLAAVLKDDVPIDCSASVSLSVRCSGVAGLPSKGNGGNWNIVYIKKNLMQYMYMWVALQYTCLYKYFLNLNLSNELYNETKNLHRLAQQRPHHLVCQILLL